MGRMFRACFLGWWRKSACRHWRVEGREERTSQERTREERGGGRQNEGNIQVSNVLSHSPRGLVTGLLGGRRDEGRKWEREGEEVS